MDFDIKDKLARYAVMRLFDGDVHSRTQQAKAEVDALLMYMHHTAGVEKLTAEANGVKLGTLFLQHRKGTPDGEAPVIVDEAALLGWLLGTDTGRHALHSAVCDPKCREELLRVAVQASPEHLPDGVETRQVKGKEGSDVPTFRADRGAAEMMRRLVDRNLSAAIERTAAGEVLELPDPLPTYEIEPTYETEE